MSSLDLVAQMVPQHLGALHGFEKLLVLLVAFGPFVVLSFVVRYAQRRDAAEDDQDQQDERGDLSGRPPAT